MENIVATLGVGLDTSAFSRPLGQISSNLRDFDKSLDASTARVLAFGASVGVLYTFQRAMIETVKSTIEIQKSLADINVIMNTTSKGLQNFGVDLFKVARDTGQSFKVVAEAATELSRQGLGMQETLKRTRDALILTRLSGLDTVSSVEALTAAINSFSDSALTSTEIINKLANVDAAFAVSSRDLAESIRRVGSSAQDVGVNIDKLIALVTSAQQTTARGGAVIGNALKTIFTRIQRTDVLDQLEMIGVRVRDMNQNVLPATEILQSLALSYDKLGQSQRSQISELVGGVYQINILKATMSDLSQENSIYAQALDKSRNSTDQAIERNKELNKTYAAQINAMMVGFKQLGATIGNYTMPSLMDKIVGDFNRILGFINNQDSEEAGAVIGRGIIKGLGEFLAGPGLIAAMYTLFKIIKSFAVDATGAIKTMMGLNTVTIEQAEIQRLIFNALKAQPEAIGKIISGQMSSLQIQKEILAITEATVRANALAANMTPATIGMLRSSNIMFDPKARVFTKRTPIPNLADYNRIIDKPIKEKIPNFTRFQDSLNESIQREIFSGVGLNDVKIGVDQRLVSADNPVGLGVYNQKDEPMGLNQGIARAYSEGKNPKNYGVPSFAYTPSISNIYVPNPSESDLYFSRRVGGFGRAAAIQNELFSLASELGGQLYQGIISQKNLNKVIGDIAEKYKLSAKGIEQFNYRMRLGAGAIRQEQELRLTPLSMTGGIIGGNIMGQNVGFGAGGGQGGTLPLMSQNYPYQRTLLGFNGGNFIQQQASETMYQGTGAVPSLAIRSTMSQQENIIIRDTIRRNQEKAAAEEEVARKQERLQKSKEKLAKQDEILNRQATAENNRRIERDQEILKQQAQKRASTISELERKSLGIFGTGLGGSRYFKELKEISEESAADVKAKTESRKMGVGLGISFFAPMMASTINEVFIRNQDKESRIRRAGVSGVGDVLSYGGMGMLMGQPYIGIGIGIITSLVRVFQELNNNLPELEENAKKAGNALARFDDNILQIINILNTLRSAKSGEIDLSVEKQRQLFSSLASKSFNIPQNQRQNLREYIETGDIAKFQEFSEKLRRPEQIKKSINDFVRDLEVYNKANIPEEEEEFAEEFDAVISRFSDITDLSGTSLFSKLGRPDVLQKLKSVKTFKQYQVPHPELGDELGKIITKIESQGLKDVLTMDLKGPEYEKERQKTYEEIDRMAQENPERLQKFVNELIRQGGWINQKWEDYKKSMEGVENIDVLRRQMSYRISTKEAESNREFDLNATIRKNLSDLSMNRQSRAIERNKLFMPETGIFMLESGVRRNEILDRFAQGKEGAFMQFKGGTAPIYQNLLEKSESLGGIYEYAENIRQIQNLISDIGMGTAKPQQLITHIESTIGFFEEFAIMSEQSNIFPLLNQITELTKNYINAQAKINDTKEKQLQNEGEILVGLTDIANINKRLSFGGGLARRLTESPILSLYGAEMMRTMGVSQLQRNQGLQTIMEEYQSRDFRPPENILIQYRRAAAQTRIDRGENPQKANILANEDVQNYLRNFSLNAPTVSLERLMQGSGFKDAGRTTGELFLEKRRTTAEKSRLELGGMQLLSSQQRESILKYDREDLLNNREIQLILTGINKELNERLYSLGEISAEELRIANAEDRQAKIQSGIYGLGDVRQAFTDQFKYNKRDLFSDLEKGAIDLGQTMKSSFKDAFKSFADGSKDAKNALRDLGLSVLNRLFERTIDTGFNLLFGGVSAGLGSIFSKRSSGGLIENFASGGFVSGGSGAIDDIPAMLSTGSYVLNKNAVNKYGTGFLNSLGVNGMANGGSAKILLKNAYLYNDPLRPSSGSLDISSNLSNYGLSDEDNPQNIIRMEREQALYQYVKEKADYEARIAWELANFKRQKSQRIQAAYLNAGIAIAGAGLGSIFSGGGGGGGITGATGNIITPGKFTNVGMSLKPMPPTGGGATVFNPNISSFNTSISFNAGMFYRANGGLINFSSGGSPIDNVPALLTGGEYVVNKNIVDKHGVNFFNKLNRGEINRFATGGFNGISSINPNIDNKSDLTDQLLKLIVVTENIRDSISKTSKLNNIGGTTTTNQNVNLTPPVNNISITVNVQKNGQVDSKVESDNSRNANKDSDENNGRKLAEIIRTVTLDTIIKQQRNGGLLAS